MMLALCPATAGAEGLDALLSRVEYDRLQSVSTEVGIQDVKRVAQEILSGAWTPEAGLWERLSRRVAASIRAGLLDVLSALAAPVLATLFLRLVFGEADGALALLCRLAAAGSLVRRFASAVQTARAALSASIRLTGVLSPVMAAALTLTGAGHSGGMLSPLSALCVDAVEKLLCGAGLSLCALAAAVAAGGALSEAFRLDRLFALIRQVTVWGVRLVVGGFVGLLALEGRLSALQDTASVDALRQALRGMVPFIGGSVSDAAGALAESAATVRGMAGVSGMLIVLAACARPLMDLAACMLSLKLASAVIEPVADAGIVRITAHYADVARMLLALCAAGAMLTLLLAGTCLGLFGA